MPTKKTDTPNKAVKNAAPKKAAGKQASEQQNVEGFSHFTPYQEKKGEEYMSPSMEAHFRDLLMTWKRELMEEVDRTVHHMQDEAANFPDPNDRASQESEFSMELRTRDRERKLLKKINEALDLLDEGEYGFCESCGVEIGVRRLEARPTATLCIDCKTLDEIREKQRG
jgi:DnaK suppressor protein